MKNVHLQKGVAAPIIIAVIAIILAGGFVYFVFRPDKSKEIPLPKEETVMEKEDGALAPSGVEGMPSSRAQAEGMEKEGERMMEKNGEMMREGDEAMTEKDNMMMKGDATGKNLQFSGKFLVNTNGSDILEYTKADYDKAVSAGKLVVLYFYANWCPICKAEYPHMEKAFMSPLSSNVVGFRVNYKDNETSSEEEDIAREFGVVYQHTKVFVKDGKRVLKDGTSWDVSRYVKEINKSLVQ